MTPAVQDLTVDLEEESHIMCARLLSSSYHYYAAALRVNPPQHPRAIKPTALYSPAPPAHNPLSGALNLYYNPSQPPLKTLPSPPPPPFPTHSPYLQQLVSDPYPPVQTGRSPGLYVRHVDAHAGPAAVLVAREADPQAAGRGVLLQLDHVELPGQAAVTLEHLFWKKREARVSEQEHHWRRHVTSK